MNIAPVLTPEKLSQWAEDARANGRRIVFTNGVFDILHIGHADYLFRARELGDLLIVGVNDDASVRRLNKAPERPVNPESARAALVASLKPVDAVVIFPQDTPLEIILSIMPDVLVKGGDYDPEETDPESKKYMVGAAEVKAAGGKAIALSLVEGFSTTSIIGRLRK
jgi:D-beta-D-heptose 7-phosphate kinase/D-beta-D-heptose 1-phosphate adenosyltransferase